jgi:hypothetical protein
MLNKKNSIDGFYYYNALLVLNHVYSHFDAEKAVDLILIIV